jgi:hypothetical protein
VTAESTAASSDWGKNGPVRETDPTAPAGASLRASWRAVVPARPMTVRDSWSPACARRASRARRPVRPSGSAGVGSTTSDAVARATTPAVCASPARRARTAAALRAPARRRNAADVTPVGRLLAASTAAMGVDEPSSTASGVTQDMGAARWINRSAGHGATCRRTIRWSTAADSLARSASSLAPRTSPICAHADWTKTSWLRRTTSAPSAAAMRCRTVVLSSRSQPSESGRSC